MCQRKIELPQNKQGIEVTGQCIITDGCHGKLHQFDFIQDGIVGRLTPDVSGLDNFVPRHILFTHNQTLTAQTWRVIHDLNTEPSVQVFVFVVVNGNEVLTETTPDAIITVSPNETLIQFSTGVKGVAQFISRSTSTFEEEKDVVDPAATQQLTINSEFTIATLSNNPILTLSAQFFSPTTLQPTSLLFFEFDNTPDPISPWSGVNRVFIKGKLHEVRSTNVKTLLEGTNIVDGSPFIVTQVDFVPIVPNSVFVLLSEFPHTTFDRNLNMIINIDSITESNLSQGLLKQGNELFAFQSTIKNIFPPVTITS